VLKIERVQWAVSLLDFTELKKLLRVTLASQSQARNLRPAKKFLYSSCDGVSFNLNSNLLIRIPPFKWSDNSLNAGLEEEGDLSWNCRTSMGARNRVGIELSIPFLGPLKV
jgi:hypothetical protein